MKRHTQALSVGTRMTLGDITYEIEGVLGFGSATIVYRARYADSWSREDYHYVLIKELFPYLPQGGIIRDEQGQIQCQAEHQAFYDHYYQSFLAGTKVNLRLLNKSPELISGNSNSYEANNTVYSVLPVHGGESLLQQLETKGSLSLAQATEMILKVLDALSVFHEEGYLHLDISADNVLVLPHQVLLIDYNSALPIERSANEILTISAKDGYSAPEVLLQDARNIAIPTDLYAVCALYAHLITGAPLTQSQLREGKFSALLAPILQKAPDLPSSASFKAIQIVTKGLQLLLRKRYPSIDALRSDLQEVLIRIHGSGLSHSALWESGRYGTRLNQPYLPQNVATKEGTTLSQSQLVQRLCQGEHFILLGAGGLGKTTYLRHIIDQFPSAYHPKQPAICYISLRAYQLQRHPKTYLFNALMSQLQFGFLTREDTFGQQIHMHYQRMLQQLSANNQRIILLLDGLHEAGAQVRGLLQEIEDLAAYPNVSILISDRGGGATGYALSKMQPITLLPLDRETVCAHLKDKNAQIQPDEGLCTLLQNPLMLSLYSQVATDGTDAPPLKEQDMIAQYLAHQRQSVANTYSGDEATIQMFHYVLDFLLPQIGGVLEKKKKSMLTMKETFRITTACLRQLNSRDFLFAFPDYMGKSRLLPSGVQNEYQWYDYCVREILVNQCHLLNETALGDITLLHDDFQSCLAQTHAQTHQHLRQATRKQRLLRRGILATVLAAAIGLGVYAWPIITSTQETEPYSYPDTEQEIKDANKIVGYLNSQMQPVDQEVQCLYTILDRASKPLVLQGDTDERTELIDYIESTYGNASYNTEWPWLWDLDLPFSTAIVETIYQSPIDMNEFSNATIVRLSEVFSPTSNVYNTQEKCQPIVEAYVDYLDAYSVRAYLQMQQLLWHLDDASEAQALFNTWVVNKPTFSQYIMKSTYHFTTLSDLENALTIAETNVEQCASALRVLNCPV